MEPSYAALPGLPPLLLHGYLLPQVKTLSLLVPRPALPLRLDKFLAANVHGLSRKQAQALIDAGQVRVGGRRQKRSATKLQPGQTVELDYRPTGTNTPEALGPDRLLASGPGWIAINKPAGLPSHRPSADIPGVPELIAKSRVAASQVSGESAPTELTPVHRLDRETSGLLLLAGPASTRAQLSALFAERRVTKHYRCVVSPPPRGTRGLAEGPKMSAEWTLLGLSQDGLRAELEVQPREGRTHQVRLLMASMGCPIVGDLEHGHPVPGGAARMALHCLRMSWEDTVIEAPLPEGWEDLLDPSTFSTPEVPGAARLKSHRPTPVEATEGPLPERRARSKGKLRQLQVSSATARILQAGHPWVIRDRDTGNLGMFQRGDLAQLVDPRGRAVAVALVEPGSSVCARVVSNQPDAQPDAASWERRAGAALARRSKTIREARTNAYRLVHGEADGLPGLFVDRWGDTLVATRTTPMADLFRPLYPLLLERSATKALWEQDHFDDLRSGGDAPRSARRCGRWAVAEREALRWVVRESDLQYFVEPTAGLTHGLYTDQRRNRDFLRALIEEDPEAGAHVGNLFAHTAAFSVACAAAGAERVVSVDLAQRYCEWAAQNLSLNGLNTTQHPVVVAGALEWLSSASGLSGVILDPPAHARSKKSRGADWNARRDYRTLVAAAATSLRPGGWLLCCINLKGLKRDWLRREVEAGLRQAGKVLGTPPELAPPSPDHPRRKGFPEGRPFHGLFVRTRE